MRVIVNCSGGASHSILLQQHTTVQDVKELVADKEGVYELYEHLCSSDSPADHQLLYYCLSRARHAVDTHTQARLSASKCCCLLGGTCSQTLLY